jgi:hypothetical protein
VVGQSVTVPHTGSSGRWTKPHFGETAEEKEEEGERREEGGEKRERVMSIRIRACFQRAASLLREDDCERGAVGRRFSVRLRATNSSCSRPTEHTSVPVHYAQYIRDCCLVLIPWCSYCFIVSTPLRA